MAIAYAGDTATDIAALRAIITSPGLVGYDFETTVAPAYQREVCLIQACHEDGREAVAYVWPHGTAWLRELFKDGCAATLVAHNSTFEAECLVKAGLEIYPECTMIAAKVLRGKMDGDKKHRIGWSLKEIMQREFNKERDKTIRESDWRERPTPEMVEYGLEDVRDTLHLWQRWLPLFEQDAGQWDGYRLMMDAMPAVVEGNLHGLPFDPQAHLVLIDILTKKIQEHDFMLDILSWNMIKNHGSTQQVAAWMREIMLAGRPRKQIDSPLAFSLLFQKATGQHWPMTDSGQMSLDRAAVESRIERLSKVAPAVAAYLLQRLQWSKVAKQKQAFGEPLRQYVGADGYARSSTRIHGAQTSRMSANSFNHQQMPREPEFRRLFKSKKGRKLIIADYGQIELRVGSIIAPDEVMQDVFRRGEDIHQASANAIKRLMTHDPEAVATSWERKLSKGPTFAALYGAMAAAIAAAAGLSIAEAEVFLNAWLDVYKGIRRYRETAMDRCKDDGGVRLVSGQFIRIAEDTRPAMAINTPVQGSSASVMYRAMALVRAELVWARAQGHDVWFCASVHDEILLDAAEGEDALVGQELLQRSMRKALLDLYPQAADMGMSESADADIVDTWAEKP